MAYETRLDRFIDPKASEGRKLLQLGRGMIGAPLGAAANASSDLLSRLNRPAIIPATTVSGLTQAQTAARAATALERPMLPAHTPGETLLRPTPQMKPAHTPGQRLIGSSRPAAPAAAPVAPPTVARLSRRVAPVPSAPAVTPQAPVPTETAPLDLGYMEQDGVRLYIPGSKSFESGVGVTESQPAAPAAPTRLRAGDLGYAGSQQEWEDNQAMVGMRTPMGLQVAAELRASRAQDETEANNLRTFGVSQQNADSTALNTMSQVQERDTLRPWKVKEQVSNLLTADATRAETAEKTAGQRLVNRFYPESIRADINYKNNLGRSVLNNADTDHALAVQELKNQAKLAEIESKAGNPLREAEATYLTGLSQQTTLPPSQVAEAVEQGFTTPVAPKKGGWFRSARPGALTNAAGQEYKPGQAKLPAGYTFSGKYTPEGKPILLDGSGKKFVQ